MKLVDTLIYVFAPHKYSTFIYQYQIIVNISVNMLGWELIGQPSYAAPTMS